MTDKIEDAFESKMATKIVMACVGIFGLLVLALLTWGGSTIYSTSISQQLMSQQVTALVDTVSDLKARIEAGSADRYTGTSAASDRAVFLSAFTSAIQTVSGSNADLFRTVSDRVQAISLRQTEFDRTLKELQDFKVRVSERMKIEEGGK